MSTRATATLAPTLAPTVPTTARKPAARTAAKTAAPARAPRSKALARAVPPPKPVITLSPLPAPAQVDAVKAKKPKLVRDSYTIPKNEYEAIATLKARALKQGLAIKKSELLRAGLMTLAFMSDAAFAKALTDVPTLKTGRPAAGASEKKVK